MATMYAPQPPQNVVYMAPQQPQQGTLLPGQTITLKHYTVTVERYLSQGGFAHVYLVRSAVPINNTTSHVLKRIAVSDDVMLKEVQKEVDVMKVLRGHPNIVNLIDSASFTHSNGTYEVFILMEFCAGGGIIDMMNRRLRERLTEQEILQIFIDVCEGVACMHNLKPALLHRDLKVENILQAGEKSFKLCDFGSAATAALKPPSSSAEIRALEQDILRHTTLQYRAPEMVEPYLRLPVDEKSDVWALGVLLYKLCYYTTPFEEHGPLAIVNVHYKIPPYPVYSPNMINLIGSMLQKYGTARPTVFSLLDTVHRMRGTRSPFSYNSSSASPASAQTFNPHASAGLVKTIGLDPRGIGATNARNDANHNVPDTDTATTGAAAANVRAAAARQHVLAAIQPMRRGRPITSAPISPGGTFPEGDVYHPTTSTAADDENPTTTANEVVHVSQHHHGQQQQRFTGIPVRKQQQGESGLVPVTQRGSGPATKSFGVAKGDGEEADAPWKISDASYAGVRTATRNSPAPASTAAATTAADSGRRAEAVLGAWELRRGGATGGGGGGEKVEAFDGFADSFDFGGSKAGSGVLSPTTTTTPGVSSSSYNAATRKRDAFEGLTGFGFGSPSAAASLNTPRRSPMPQPSPSPRATGGGAGSSELSAEERFPSIEDYERKSPAPATSSSSLQAPMGIRDWKKSSSASSPQPRAAALTPQPSQPPHPSTTQSYRGSGFINPGARSQHTTGTAMKDAEAERKLTRAGSSFTTVVNVPPTTGPPQAMVGLTRRQSLNAPIGAGVGRRQEPALPPRPAQKRPELGQRMPSAPPKDWLTGNDVSPPQAQPAKTTTTGGGPGLQRKLSASFMRRASAFGTPIQKPPSDDSSGDDGPEDVAASARKAFQPLQKKQSVDRFGGRRQESVHDLIDVHSDAHPPKQPTKKKSFGRRQDSVHDLIDVNAEPTTTTVTGRPRAESPTPLKSGGASQFRFPTGAGETTPNRRPQSMFISASPASNLAVPKPPPSPAAEPSSPDSPRKPQRVRRNSIVDLVSRYEAIEAASKPPPVLIATKPKPPTIAAPGHGRNQSQTHFTGTKKLSLDVPAVQVNPRMSPPFQRKSVSPRESYFPTPSPQAPPHPEPIRRSPVSIAAPPPTRPININLAPVLPMTTHAPTPPTHSPSPERPYQGVASLINQWQKKTEDASSTTKPRAWK